MSALYISIGEGNNYSIKISFIQLIAKLIVDNVSKTFFDGFDGDKKSLIQLSRTWLEGGIYLDSLDSSQFQEVILAMAKGYEFLGSIIGNEQAEEKFVEGQIGTGQPVKNLRFYLGEIIELAKQDPRFDKTLFEVQINLDNKS